MCGFAHAALRAWLCVRGFACAALRACGFAAPQVDVEGYDMAVLAGAIEQLKNHLWFVQFEWGSQFFKGEVRCA